MSKQKSPRSLFRETVRSTLRGIAAGESAAFALPDNRCTRRIAYQDVNMVAYALWGAGMYQMTSKKNGAEVTVRPVLETRVKWIPPEPPSVNQQWTSFVDRYRQFLEE